jgi:hypothetical protein
MYGLEGDLIGVVPSVSLSLCVSVSVARCSSRVSYRLYLVPLATSRKYGDKNKVGLLGAKREEMGFQDWTVLSVG